jgi:hypothetical protein
MQAMGSSPLLGFCSGETSTGGHLQLSRKLFIFTRAVVWWAETAMNARPTAKPCTLVKAYMKTLLSILLLSNICYSQNTIIWEITDAMNSKKSFIVGTFHNIGNSFVDSIPVLKAALLNSDVAIFESIDDEAKLV